MSQYQAMVGGPRRDTYSTLGAQGEYGDRATYAGLGSTDGEEFAGFDAAVEREIYAGFDAVTKPSYPPGVAVGSPWYHGICPRFIAERTLYSAGNAGAVLSCLSTVLSPAQLACFPALQPACPPPCLRLGANYQALAHCSCVH